MDAKSYNKLYQKSITSPELFWKGQAKLLDWDTPFKTAKHTTGSEWDTKWFLGGELNAAYNCIDRHLVKDANKTALLWVSNDLNTIKISYHELHQQVCKLANGLKKLGVKKGEVVTIYMPMIPETAYAMLACARIGAIHSVVFAGFSALALAERITACKSSIIMTAEVSFRGTKVIPLKSTVNEAVSSCPMVTHVVTVPNAINPEN